MLRGASFCMWCCWSRGKEQEFNRFNLGLSVLSREEEEEFMRTVWPETEASSSVVGCRSKKVRSLVEYWIWCGSATPSRLQSSVDSRLPGRHT